MTIEQRLDQLEKRNKRLTVALTLMAVAMCAAVTMAATGNKRGEFDTVVARDIFVKNDMGRTAVSLTAPGGTTVAVGLPHPDVRVPVSPLALVAEGRHIVGSYLGSAVPERDIPTYVAMWRQGRLPVEELISARIPLSAINRGMDDLAAGRAIRQVIDVTT